MPKKSIRSKTLAKTYYPNMKDNQILVFYAFLPEQGIELSPILEQLPQFMQDQVLSYKRPLDQQLVALGKILLLEGMSELGYSSCLDDMQYSTFGKPFLPRGPFFNISHTGQLAICALSTSFDIGIDSEQIQEIALMDFKSFLNPEEWEQIHASSNTLLSFYHLWVKKEAVLKAIGKGLSLPLKEIKLHGESAQTLEEFFFLKQVEIHEDYPCYLAVAQKDVRFRLLKRQF